MLAGALQRFLDMMVKLYGDPSEFGKVSKKLRGWGKHRSYFKALGLEWRSLI